MANYAMKAEGGVFNFSPYGMALSSQHLFNMARDYDGGKAAATTRVLVLCISLELGMKGAILSRDCNDATKKKLKCLRHDLVKLHEEFRVCWGSDPFDTSAAATIAMISELFRRKGLEYFTGDMLAAIANGHEGIPEVDQLLEASEKLQALLSDNKFFADA